jgi:hypothetical protein
MNKLILFAAAIAATSMAACGTGGNDKDAQESPDTVVIVEDAVSVTPIDSDSVAVTEIQSAAVATTD